MDRFLRIVPSPPDGEAEEHPEGEQDREHAPRQIGKQDRNQDGKQNGKQNGKQDRNPANKSDTKDDAALVAGVRAMESWAMPALVERHGAHVRRVLMRVLDARDGESADVFQEVILRAWEGIDDLQEPAALKAWLTQIAVFTARGVIRRRRRNRWLAFFDAVPEPEVSWAGPDLQDAAGCVYRIFDRMPVDERIPFSLRVLDGMDLDATAAACGMSLATVRRRLVKAERRFFKMARQYEALRPWVETR